MWERKSQRVNLYERAAALWPDYQLAMVCEECAELIQAVCKLQRYGTDCPEYVMQAIAELADVQIVTERLGLLLQGLGLDVEKLVAENVEYTLTRLSSKVESVERSRKLPKYEYRCASCGHQWEVQHPIGEMQTTCPKCCRKTISAVIGNPGYVTWEGGSPTGALGE